MAGESRHHPHQICIEEALQTARLRFVPLSLLRMLASDFDRLVDSGDGRMTLGRDFSHGFGFALPMTKHDLGTPCSGTGRKLRGSTWSANS